MGFDISQEFPIYADRMPTQLLAYLRLSRLQDSGEMAKVNSLVFCLSFVAKLTLSTACHDLLVHHFYSPVILACLASCNQSANLQHA